MVAYHIIHAVTVASIRGEYHLERVVVRKGKIKHIVRCEFSQLRMIVEDSSLLGVKLDFQPYYQMQIQSIEDDYRGFQPVGDKP